MRLEKRIHIILLVMLISFVWNCDPIDPQDGELTEYTCEGCHTNYGALNKVINDLKLEGDDAGHAAPG